MLDSWLWRRRIRIETLGTCWTAAREDSPVLLSVSEGRFGFPVIEQVQPARARVR